MHILDNVEYFENLLSFVVGRDSAKSDAEKILGAFTSPADIANTHTVVMQNISGCSERSTEFIRLLAALNSRRITDNFKSGRKYLKSDIERLICALLFPFTVESVYMISFDKKGKFIAFDLITEGTVNSSAFLPRKMVDLALKRKAASVILAHNHPSGNLEPSDNDVSVTLLAESVLNDTHIRLDAHYITVGFTFTDCLEYIKKQAKNHTAEILSVNHV